MMVSNFNNLNMVIDLLKLYTDIWKIIYYTKFELISNLTNSKNVKHKILYPLYGMTQKFVIFKGLIWSNLKTLKIMCKIEKSVCYIMYAKGSNYMSDVNVNNS